MTPIFPPSGEQPLSAQQLQALIDQELRDLASRCHVQATQLREARKELLSDLILNELQSAADRELAAADPAGALLKSAFVAWVRKEPLALREHSLDWLKQTSGVELGQTIHVFCTSPPLELLLRDFSLDFGDGPSQLDACLRLSGTTTLINKQGTPVGELRLPLDVRLRVAAPSRELLLRLEQCSSLGT